MISNTTYNTYIGAITASAPSTSMWNFPGRIDDVRGYRRTLTSAEVAALYTNTNPTTTGLVAYLPLETGTGTTTPVLDATGATIATATLTNGPTWSSSVPPVLAP